MSRSSINDASVKVSPYLTIGNGDGRMILNIYARGDGSFDTSLPVFDGVEMALHTVDTASSQINEQTFEAWMQANPYRDVQAGFAQMISYLRGRDLDTLPGKTVERIGKLVKREQLEADNVQDALKAMNQRLLDLSAQREARAEVFKAMATSSDHMASAQRPHTRQGVVAAETDATDFKTIAETMNTLYAEKLLKLRLKLPGRDVVAGYAQAPVKELEEAIRTVGQPVIGYETVTRISGPALVKLMAGSTAKTGASREQQGFVRDLEALSSLSPDSVFYFGEPTLLEMIRDRFHPNLPKGRIQLGQTFVNSEIGFIANTAPETVIHEISHRYTAKVLQKHYGDPEASPAQVRHAVSQLEKLSEDILALNGFGLDPADRQALETLQDVLRDPQWESRPDVHLGELIAYTLSNPGLIGKTSKTSSYRGLTSIVTEALKWIRKLLGFKGNPGLSLYSNIRFNARLLLAQEPSLEQPSEVEAEERAESEIDVALNQVYGQDLRLEEIEKTFLGKLNRLLEGLSGTQRVIAGGRIAQLRETAQHAAEWANQSGFGLSGREAQAFEVVHAAMSTGFTKGQPVQRHLYEAFTHVVKTVTIDDFLKATGTEENPSLQNLAKAQAMLDFLIGAKGLRSTPDGRTDMLASFLALSQISPVMREVLGSMKPPKVVELQWDSIDNWLRSLARTVVNLITRASLTPRRMAPDLRRELDALSGVLTRVQGERKFLAEVARVNRKLAGWTDQANEKISGKMDEVAVKGTTKLDALGSKARNPKVKGAYALAAPAPKRPASGAAKPAAPAQEPARRVPKSGYGR